MYLDESYDVAHDKVSRFVRIHGITKNDVDNYIREFPIAIFKYYYELRLDDVFFFRSFLDCNTYIPIDF